MDIKQTILTEWDVLKKSLVVRGLITMELGAVSLFVEQVLDGKQELTLDALKGWLGVQAILIMAFLFRHAWAGIEVQLAGKVPDETIARLEKKAQDRAVRALQGSHPEAAKTLQAAFAQGDEAPIKLPLADSKPEGA